MADLTYFQLVNIEPPSARTGASLSPSDNDVTLLPGTGFIPDIIRGQVVIGRMCQEITSPESLLTSELGTIERIVDFVAAKHHLRAIDAADFTSHVNLKLVERDYAILRRFEGRSSLRTYLTVVIQRLFFDYAAAKWGKWRSSAEAKRAGDVGIILEQLLWRDGYSFEEACEVLKTNYQIAARREDLERIAGLLPERPKRRFESDASLVDRADPTAADALVKRSDRSRVAQRVLLALKRLIAGAEPRERLALVMRYVDGRSVADIASMLDLDQKRLYRRLEDLRRNLRKGLQAEGIGAEEALAIFDDPDISVDWDDEFEDRL